MAQRSLTAQRSHRERRTEREVATAALLMEVAATAGVAESPSAVRYRLARILRDELSQASVNRLHEALRHDRAVANRDSA